MGNHNTNPIKYCATCETHFKADPEVHEETYHSGEPWVYIEGSWSDADFRKV